MSSSNLPDIEVEKSLHLDLSNVEVQEILQSHEYIYQCNNYSEFAVTFSESIIFARQIATTLIKKAQATAEAKQLARDLPIHATNFAQEIAFSLAILCSNEQYTKKDQCNVEEDNEPEPVVEDAWRRNNTIIKVKNQLQTSSTIEHSKFHKEPHRHYSRESTKGPLEKTQLNIPKHEKDPLPVPLVQDHDDDDYQDKLRNVKQYEQRKKQEAEIKKNTEKAKKIQQKVHKPDRNDTGPKKYTFDFDGSILPNKGVKVEKLCPPNYLINFTVQEANKNPTQETQISVKVRKGKQKQENSTDAIPSQKVVNKILEDRKDQIKDSLGDKAIKANSIIQFPYENFNMNSGVKLVFESKMKECARLQVRDSVEALTYKLSGGNQIHSPRHSDSQFQDALRLTRTEYFLLTQNGNMQSQTTTIREDKQTHHTLVSSSKQKLLKVDVPLQELKQEIQKASTISIKNNKQIQKLIDEEDTPLQKLDKMKAGKVKPPPNQDEKPKNPLDQFNQTLLQSKDWGKQVGQSYLPPIKQQKADTEQYKASLEQQYKKPRERLTDQDARTQIKFHDTKNISKNLKKLQKLENFQTFYTTHSKFNEILRNN